MYNKFGDNLRAIRVQREMSQEELAVLLGTSKQVISRYEKGQRTPKITTVREYAEKLGVSLNTLTGYIDTEADSPHSIFSLPGIVPIETYRIPVLGAVSCGALKFADEEFEGYVECGANIHADFALRASGDSMIGARIMDGDIVIVRRQDIVETGEVAVVLVDDEITLKRFRRVGNVVILSPENPAYADIIVNLDEATNVRILGKAVAFQSNVI